MKKFLVLALSALVLIGCTKKKEVEVIVLNRNIKNKN